MSGDASGDPLAADAKAGRRVPVWAWIVVGLVVVALVIGGVALAASSEPKATYDAGTEQRFVDACAAQGGDPVRPACQCVYGQVVSVIPYDRFAEVSDELVAAAEAGQPVVWPEDFQALVPACKIPA